MVREKESTEEIIKLKHSEVTKGEIKIKIVCLKSVVD